MGWWFHVEDKAMDAVLDERPQEPARQKEQRESVLMDRDRDVWEHEHTHTHENYENKHVRGCVVSENENESLW